MDIIDAIFEGLKARFDHWVDDHFPLPEPAPPAAPGNIWPVREDPRAKRRLRRLLDDDDLSDINVYRVCRDICEGRLKLDEIARQELTTKLEALGFAGDEISEVLLPLICESRQAPIMPDSVLWNRLRPQAQRLHAH